MANYDDMSFDECMRSLDLLILQPTSKKEKKAFKRLGQKKSAPKLVVPLPIRFAKATDTSVSQRPLLRRNAERNLFTQYWSPTRQNYHKYLAKKAKRRGILKQQEETQKKLSVVKKTKSDKTKIIPRKVIDSYTRQNKFQDSSSSNKLEKTDTKSYNKAVNKKDDHYKKDETLPIMSINVSDIPIPAGSPSTSAHLKDCKSVGGLNLTYSRTQETAPIAPKQKQLEQLSRTQKVISNNNSETDTKKFTIFKNIKCDGDKRNAVVNNEKNRRNEKKINVDKNNKEKKNYEKHENIKVEKSSAKRTYKNVTSSTENITDIVPHLNTVFDKEQNKWSNQLGLATVTMLISRSGLTKSVIKTFSNVVRLLRRRKGTKNKKLALVGKMFLEHIIMDFTMFIENNAEYLSKLSQIINVVKGKHDDSEVLPQKRRRFNSEGKEGHSQEKKKRPMRQRYERTEHENSTSVRQNKNYIPHRTTVQNTCLHTNTATTQTDCVVAVATTQTETDPQVTSQFRHGQHLLPTSNASQLYVSHRASIPNTCLPTATATTQTVCVVVATTQTEADPQIPLTFLPTTTATTQTEEDLQIPNTCLHTNTATTQTEADPQGTAQFWNVLNLLPASNASHVPYRTSIPNICLHTNTATTQTVLVVAVATTQTQADPQIPNICFEKSAYDFHKKDPRFSRYCDPEYRRLSVENPCTQVKSHKESVWGRHYNQDHSRQRKQVQNSNHNLKHIPKNSSQVPNGSCPIEQQLKKMMTSNSKCSIIVPRRFPKR